MIGAPGLHGALDVLPGLQIPRQDLVHQARDLGVAGKPEHHQVTPGKPGDVGGALRTKIAAMTLKNSSPTRACTTGNPAARPSTRLQITLLR